MKKVKRPFIIGNWKGYIKTLTEAKRHFRSTLRALPPSLRAEVIICPPAPFINALSGSYRGKRISFGAQYMDGEEVGEKTGVLTPEMLFGVGARFVMVGHAEVRARGENDVVVGEKVARVLDGKMKPIVCVGENARDQNGDYLGLLKESITTSLSRIRENDLKKIIIAYEPVWAIGAPTPPSPAVIREAILFIRKVLSERFLKEVVFKTKIVYGGAVSADSVLEIVRTEGVDGVLLGRASADIDSFKNLISTIHTR